MKKISFLLICAMLVSLTACNRKYQIEERVTTTYYKDGSTVTKLYSKTAPEEQVVAEEEVQEEPEVVMEEPKLPKLRACKLKKMIRQQMKERESDREICEIATGYYECNNGQERMTLYKLAANNLITLTCEEIMNGNKPTYWVNVELTWKGKWLVVNEEKQFPEDKIDWNEASKILTPHLDQDEWGIPTYDNDVDSVIIIGMHNFYAALAKGKSVTNSLMSADMTCALSLIETLKSYDVQKLSECPFCRGVELTEEVINNMQILRMPRLQNGYMVTLGNQDFLYAISMENGVVEVQDVVCATPDADKKRTPTVCSIAGKITEREILKARADKRARMKALANAKEKKNNKQAKEEEETEHFEMCNINNAGIQCVEHTDPTLYSIAKDKEHRVIVKMLAAKYKVVKVRDIKVEMMGEDIIASAVVVIRTVRVNALGRIFYQLKNKDIEKYNVVAYYDEDKGWVLE